MLPDGARYARIAESIAKVRAEFIAAGFCPPAVDDALRTIEESACADERAAAEAFRALVRAIGPHAVADRHGVSVRQVRRRLAIALNKIGHRARA